jgi:hypothetical protein
MVFILVLCIVVIVVSPYVDLPLTTVRTCLAAVLFTQVLLLGAVLQPPKLRLKALGISVVGALQSSCRPTVQLLPLLCAYLC